MMASMFKAGMMAATLLLVTHTSGWSDDGPMRHDSQRRDFDRQNGPHKQGRDQIGTDGLPSVISGLGTFAGAVSALRVRGNGIYFSSDITRTGTPRETRPVPLAKIISLSANGDVAHACTYEAGVCVIRGRR